MLPCSVQSILQTFVLPFSDRWILHGMASGFTFNRWYASSGSIPRMSYAFHVKISILAFRKFTNSAFFIGGNCVPTWKYCFGSSPIIIFFNSSDDSPDVPAYCLSVAPFDCYWIASLFTATGPDDCCVTVDTRHCLAMA